MRNYYGAVKIRDSNYANIRQVRNGLGDHAWAVVSIENTKGVQWQRQALTITSLVIQTFHGYVRHFRLHLDLVPR